LAAVILGPWMGILVMTAVIALQALLFQDGGLVVMGANIFIMGVIPAMVGYGLYRAAVHRSQRFQTLLAAAAAWLSVMAAAFVTALLLGFSGTSSFSVAIPAMLGIHAFIGIGEAFITTAALGLIRRSRPQLLQTSAEAGGRGWIVAGILIAFVVVLFAPLASAFPDGLEWVAEQNGFLGAAREAPYSILPDYVIPALGDSGLSTILAGAIGTIIVALLAYGVAWLLRRGRKTGRTTGEVSG
jgi:cobalt/nickel transport system permease protein